MRRLLTIKARELTIDHLVVDSERDRSAELGKETDFRSYRIESNLRSYRIESIERVIGVRSIRVHTNGRGTWNLKPDEYVVIVLES